MDDDVVIKLIYSVSLTIIYAILFIRVPLDMAIITTLVSSFTTALSVVITYNITKKTVEKRYMARHR